MLIFRETRSSNGNYFVMMFNTPSDFQEFQYVGVTVGDVICIAEPFFDERYVSDIFDLPIVTSDVARECCRVPSGQLTETTVLPNDIMAPSAGCTVSFRNVGVKIAVKRVAFVEMNCNGVLCDRQTNVCSCMFNDCKGYNFTLTMRVRMTGVYDKEIPFGSLKFTKMVVVAETAMIHMTTMLQSILVRRALRAKLNLLIQHVNNNGGWDIVGWARAGEKFDTADGVSKIASDTLMPHIVHMEPHSIKVPNEMEFDIEAMNDAGHVDTIDQSGNANTTEDFGNADPTQNEDPVSV